jgi:rhomboid family GlyGly-CTERM serine protease
MNVRQPVDRFKSLLASLNGDGRYGVTLLALCILLLLPELAGEWARAGLSYQRTAIGAGEWWRLATAHVVHLDLEHALLNTLGLVLMWSLFARDYRPREWLVILATVLAGIDAGLWLRDTNVAWYVGASGALHGIMTAGTVAHVRRGDLDGWILAVFVVAKLSYEQWNGALPFNESGEPVVVNAHLYGSLAGLAAGLAFRPQRPAEQEPQPEPPHP